MKYKLVSGGPVRIESKKEVFIKDVSDAGYPYIGEYMSAHTRKEMQHAPIFKGLYGPMYDKVDGEACMRYETPEMNDLLSR